MAHYRTIQIEDYEPLVGRETVKRIRQKAAKYQLIYRSLSKSPASIRGKIPKESWKRSSWPANRSTRGWYCSGIL